MKNALQLASEMFGQQQGRAPMLNMITSDAVNNPRNGLRRWVIRSNHYSEDPHELVDWALVELHHDGSVALAIGLVRALTGVELPGNDAAVWHVWVKIVDAVIGASLRLVDGGESRGGWSGRSHPYSRCCAPVASLGWPARNAVMRFSACEKDGSAWLAIHDDARAT
ncbi:hypothetical protein GCM10011609_85630 [Lentzea pudingi]|uniref:Uncharacterized protein n=1 Tax=Lentzea pudingi TaxID=1789439 RepID=A0ABQ2IW26_9PSEU|nr:hypothetical protein [Lentzea pudingi]GGN28972.1 hypothetical protein GCM10011609_85630 [Lentzea pudingi]